MVGGSGMFNGVDGNDLQFAVWARTRTIIYAYAYHHVGMSASRALGSKDAHAAHTAGAHYARSAQAFGPGCHIISSSFRVNVNT